MSESKNNINNKRQRMSDIVKISSILNQALCEAMIKYKALNGKLPECGYHVQFIDGMTMEEELLEVFHALVRSGVNPEDAKEQALVELDKIYAKMAMFEEAVSH